MMKHIFAACLIGVLLAIAAPPLTALAQPAAGVRTGPSGLPIPRFVSLKSDEVNMRAGPGTDYRIRWVYRKEGLPVEIVTEFSNWRRVRDADGEEGWIYHSLLSSERTALVRPWGGVDTVPLRAQPQDSARIVALLEPKVLAKVRQCDGTWCAVEGHGWSGFLEQIELWGVYPGEVFR